MSDENEFQDELDQIRASMDAGTRRARIRALSDEALVYIYSILSDTRIIVNVEALPELEAEMRRRGLPNADRH